MELDLEGYPIIKNLQTRPYPAKKFYYFNFIAKTIQVSPYHASAFYLKTETQQLCVEESSQA